MGDGTDPNAEERPVLWGRSWPALLLLGLGVSLAFVGSMLAATDGHVAPQVVDLYLVCQYARAMAEGHPFQYNAGEAASTGATSPLHTVLLAAAHAGGLRGEGTIAFAILLGALLFIGSVLLARRIGVRLGGERVGLSAGVLVALSGPVAWGFLYGSDIALFSFLTLALLNRLLREWNGPSLTGGILIATLLVLARPEGLPLALLLGAAWHLGPARGWRGLRRALPWIPSLFGLGVLGLYKGLTGLWLGTSVADKSLLANYTPADALALTAEYGTDVVRGLLLGLYPSQVGVGFARGWAPYFFPPLSLLLVLLALVRLPVGLRTPVRLWVAISAVVCALVSPNLFMGVHFNRYVLWAFPTLLILTAHGFSTATRHMARGDADLERSLFRAGGVVACVLGLLGTARFAALYGEMAGHVYMRDVKTAEWIVRNLPPGVAMANLATSVEYLTGHRNMNLHGVTSPAFFGNHTAEREAGVFEALGRLPQEQRPAYLLTSVSAQEGFPSMRQLVEGAPIFQSASFVGDEIQIFRLRYDLVGKNGRLFLPESLSAVRGLQEVDRLNVCDSRDEVDHGYSFRSGVGGLHLHGAARLASYALPPGESVLDGGRAIIGSETFAVRTLANRELVVLMRTAAVADANVLRASGSTAVSVELPEASFNLRAGGQVSGRVFLRPRPGWDEHVVRIPASLVTSTLTELELSGRYASFYYWFYQ